MRAHGDHTHRRSEHRSGGAAAVLACSVFGSADAGGVLVPQLALDHLARGRAGQAVTEVELPGHLVAGQVLAGEARELTGQVVAEVEYRLTPRPPEQIKELVRELIARRKATQPTNKRTFGSVFKNPDHELGAGQLLEACGLKGILSRATAAFLAELDGHTLATLLPEPAPRERPITLHRRAAI